MYLETPSEGYVDGERTAFDVDVNALRASTHKRLATHTLCSRVHVSAFDFRFHHTSPASSLSSHFFPHFPFPLYTSCLPSAVSKAQAACSRSCSSTCRSLSLSRETQVASVRPCSLIALSDTRRSHCEEREKTAPLVCVTAIPSLFFRRREWKGCRRGKEREAASERGFASRSVRSGARDVLPSILMTLLSV